MNHHQYREGLLERLRRFKLNDPHLTLKEARKSLRPTLTNEDIDLLFDNWLNANFDRVIISEVKPGQFTAQVTTKRLVKTKTPEERKREEGARARAAEQLAKEIESDLRQRFIAELWDTVLPGTDVVLRDARKKHLKASSGWLLDVLKVVPGNQNTRIYGNIRPEALFNIAKRHGYGKD